MDKSRIQFIAVMLYKKLFLEIRGNWRCASTQLLLTSF